MLLVFKMSLIAQQTGYKIKVDTSGHISYWNGIDTWIDVQPGFPGQNLQFNGGLPLWIDNPFGITTQNASLITGIYAKSGGSIKSNGGAPITARGVCWSTNHDPTLANNHTVDGSGIGTFESNITGLNNNTTYYVRTYATNSKGTLYGNEISFTTNSNNFNPSEIYYDFDNNQYTAVQIGNQIWMKENLKTTHYKNGNAIAYLPDDNDWKYNLSGAYVYPENSYNLKNTYGALYNWYAVATGNLCPTGWHVPDETDWNTLTSYLGSETIAGGKLKEAGLTHWLSPNTGATDESGSTALPAGYRYSGLNYWEVDVFQSVGYQGYWWSTYGDGNYASGRYLIYNDGTLHYAAWSKIYGLSVRCIKD